MRRDIRAHVLLVALASLAGACAGHVAHEIRAARGTPTAPVADSVVKIDLDRTRPTFGTIVGHYKGNVDTYVDQSQLPCVDFTGNNPPWYPQGLGSCAQQDLDFGASPNVFTDSSGRKLVGAGQKSGVYHVFDAATMAPVWQTPVGPPSAFGGIVGSTAVDESGIYGPITIGGYLWSLDRTGGGRWVTPVADGVHWGNPVALANNIVYTVDLKGHPPEQLPLPSGGFASYSPDGTRLAYNRIFREFRTWKRYRGGMADDISIYDFTT